ncbi:hypothetical protein EYV94_24645 [Puteibacter caeruleilacunae]|nr:hypothetical protein EYV94_24645 [Puteibacter caeruleilacunae]
MKTEKICLLVIAVLFVNLLPAQNIKLSETQFVPIGSEMSIVSYKGKKCVKVERRSDIKGADMPTYAKVKNIDFKNGTIKVSVLSKIQKNAGPRARGFIGVSFRINDDDSKFENIYLRPANARAEDQLRRNHSIQYFSYPDFKFNVLRKEFPGKYESYADMTLDEWIEMVIVVKDEQAKLYLNGAKHPCLIVNDLKHGTDSSGAIGLFAGIGTEGYFTDLKIESFKDFKD